MGEKVTRRLVNYLDQDLETDPDDGDTVIYDAATGRYLPSSGSPYLATQANTFYATGTSKTIDNSNVEWDVAAGWLTGHSDFRVQPSNHERIEILKSGLYKTIITLDDIQANGAPIPQFIRCGVGSISGFVGSEWTDEETNSVFYVPAAGAQIRAANYVKADAGQLLTWHPAALGGGQPISNLVVLAVMRLA